MDHLPATLAPRCCGGAEPEGGGALPSGHSPPTLPASSSPSQDAQKHEEAHHSKTLPNTNRQYRLSFVLATTLRHQNRNIYKQQRKWMFTQPIPPPNTHPQAQLFSDTLPVPSREAQGLRCSGRRPSSPGLLPGLAWAPWFLHSHKPVPGLVTAPQPIWDPETALVTWLPCCKASTGCGVRPHCTSCHLSHNLPPLCLVGILLPGLQITRPSFLPRFSSETIASQSLNSPVPIAHPQTKTEGFPFIPDTGGLVSSPP